jgi:hypothetical protein
MALKNPNIEMLETTARDLGPLIHETVFLGGAATGLLLTDPATPPIRITRDIDVIIEVVSLAFYESLPGHLPPDKASQARSAQILQRIDKIIVQTT